MMFILVQCRVILLLHHVEFPGGGCAITSEVLAAVTMAGCDVAYSNRSSPTFRRNVLPLFSGSKSKPSKKQAGFI
jgi:hypothetical protein